MKKHLFSFGLILLAVSATAQTATHKLGITAGGGFQQYNGDLGNAFFKKNNSSYGTNNITVGYYLTKSFDASVFGFIGDYGYCQPEEMKNIEVDEKDRCPGCLGRIGMGNLNSRIVSAGFFVKYKIANGYLLSENSKIKPYIYLGASVCHLADRMKKKCVVVGSYSVINAGIGFQYYLNDRISIGYNLGFGYFTTDKLDYISRGRNDMYLQNTFPLAIDLF